MVCCCSEVLGYKIVHRLFPGLWWWWHLVTIAIALCCCNGEGPICLPIYRVIIGSLWVVIRRECLLT